MTSPTSPPTFISYSHDSAAHKAAVLDLAQTLRQDSIDVSIDQFHPSPPEGWPRWMANQIERARFVLLICTPTYCDRAEGRTAPGVGAGASWEASIITQELYEANARNDRFVPVVLDGEDTEARPDFIRPYTYFRWPSQRVELLRHLTGQPAVVPAPLGTTPMLPPSPVRAAAKLLPAGVGGRVPLARALLAAESAVALPRREIEIWPYSSVGFQPVQLPEIVRSAGIEARAAEALTFPDLLDYSLKPKRLSNGLVWRVHAPDRPQVDWAWALAIDGSVAGHVVLWEAARENAPAWGKNGVGIATCVELVIATIVFSDRVLTHATRRRPCDFEFRLRGVKGRHIAYDNDEGNRSTSYALHVPSCDEEDIVTTAKVHAEVSADVLRRVALEMVAALSYHFGTIDERFVSERIENALRLVGMI